MCEHKKSRRCHAPTRVSFSNQKRLCEHRPPFRWFDSPDTRGCKSHNIACAMLSTAGLLTYLSCHTFPTLWLCQSCGQWFLWYKPLSANILQTIQGENYSSEYCFGFGVFLSPHRIPFCSTLGGNRLRCKDSEKRYMDKKNGGEW